jgi:hypothetical protein
MASEVLTPEGDQDGVVAGHAQKAQAHDQQPRNGAAAEGHLHGGVQAASGGLGGTHVGAHRDVHADVAGQSGEHRADGEPDGGGQTQEGSDQEAENDADDGDGGVLAVQVGRGAFLNRGGDLLHALRAGGLGEDPLHRDGAVDECDDGTDQGEDKSCGHNDSPSCWMFGPRA